jgi:hypothetical protein
MTREADRRAADLDRFRSYLLLLARAGSGPAVRCHVHYSARSGANYSLMTSVVETYRQRHGAHGALPEAWYHFQMRQHGGEG